jgi:hypothetical protein
VRTQRVGDRAPAQHASADCSASWQARAEITARWNILHFSKFERRVTAIVCGLPHVTNVPDFNHYFPKPMNGRREIPIAAH